MSMKTNGVVVNERMPLVTATTCTGCCRISAVAPIPVYACKIEDGAIWVDMDQQLNDAAIPHKPYH